MWMNDQKCDAFEIAKRMAKTNQEINGQQCIRNDVLHWQPVMKLRKQPEKIITRSF